MFFIWPHLRRHVIVLQAFWPPVPQSLIVIPSVMLDVVSRADSLSPETMLFMKAKDCSVSY